MIELVLPITIRTGVVPSAKGGQADTGLRIELCGEIHVAAIFGIAPSDGAEQRQVKDAA